MQSILVCNFSVTVRVCRRDLEFRRIAVHKWIPCIHPPLFGANHSPNPRINTVRKQSDGVEWRSDMAPERAPTRSDGIERTNGLVRSVALFGINVSTPEVCNGFQSHLYIQCRRVGRIRSYFHCNYSMAH